MSDYVYTGECDPIDCPTCLHTHDWAYRFIPCAGCREQGCAECFQKCNSCSERYCEKCLALGRVCRPCFALELEELFVSTALEKAA